jgi:hypothetical protein
VICKIPNFLPEKFFNRYNENYPVEHIISHCANPQASEHEASLDGNYSAPVQEQDFLDHIHDIVLPILKEKHLGSEPKHDHHYVNFHMDEPGSSLEIHNDLKNFRWLITCQIYFDDNHQGVRILDDHLNILEQIPCKPNLFYSLDASPWSWHNVHELTERKRSILFRVGKKRHRTIAHYKPGEDAWLIVNDAHSDKHYAKLGPRMGNLTEAWLWRQGAYNICHTDWRADWEPQLEKLKRRFDKVNIIPSGVFNNLGTVMVTDRNYKEIADIVFNRNRQPSFLNMAEATMAEYYEYGNHMVYIDL